MTLVHGHGTHPASIKLYLILTARVSDSEVNGILNNLRGLQEMSEGLGEVSSNGKNPYSTLTGIGWASNTPMMERQHYGQYTGIPGAFGPAIQQQYMNLQVLVRVDFYVTFQGFLNVYSHTFYCI